MKVHVWFMFFMAVTFFVQGQDVNRKYMDPRFDREVMVGKCTREGLEQDEEFGESFNDEYFDYQPNDVIISKIKKQKNNYEIIIVLGSWCGDSKEQVPRFYRIIDEARIKEKKLTVICVDGQKTCPDIDLQAYHIEFVPTFIFFRKGEEIGRIVETPQISLEEDMLNILK